MIIPLLIGFGLLAVLIVTDRGEDHTDSWTVGWLIILLVIGLMMWGWLPYAIGFKEGVYR